MCTLYHSLSKARGQAYFFSSAFAAKNSIQSHTFWCPNQFPHASCFHYLDMPLLSALTMSKRIFHSGLLSAAFELN